MNNNEQIQTYRPLGESSLVVRVSEDGVNLSEALTYKLYDRYFEQTIARGDKPDEFTPNFVYVLDGGLVFRLWDGSEGPEKVVLQFMADPEHDRPGLDIMRDIPSVLRDAGVGNEQALKKLMTAIEAPARSEGRGYTPN